MQHTPTRVKRGSFWVIMYVLSCFSLINAQNVGIGTTTPHPSAQLEVKSTNQGVLIPRLTTMQRDAISNPAHSLLIFNTDNFCIEIYDSVSGGWLAVSCPIACPICDTIRCQVPVIDSIVGPTVICAGDTVQYTLYGSGGVAYIWNIPSDWELLSQGMTSLFVSGDSGVVYGHLCNQCGCSSDSIIVSVGSSPASTLLDGADSVCVADTIVIRASGGSYYNWYVPNNWIVIYQGDSLVAVPLDTGNYYVVAEACNGCGCSPRDSFSITVLDTAFGSVSVIGPNFVCVGDTVVYKASAPNGAVWNWQYPQSWQIISQNGDSIVLVPDTADGNISVEVCSGGGCVRCSNSTLGVVTESCTSFCMTIGGDTLDKAWSIIETNDGGYIVAGETYSFGAGDGDMYILKLDKAGNIKWSKTIGGTARDWAFSVIQTSDGGYAVAGGTYSFGVGGADMYIVKLDYNGNIQWTRTVGGPNGEYAKSIIQTLDGGYAMVGQYDWGTGVPKVYIVKLDVNGNLQWTRIINLGRYGDGASSIFQASNGDYIVTGYTQAVGVGTDLDIYVVRLDSLGNLIWTKTIGWTIDDNSQTIISTMDGGFSIVGYTNSFGAGYADMYVLKLDTASNIQWAKTVGGADNDFATSIVQTSDKGYIISGVTLSFGAGNYDVYAVKLDSSGNIQWTRTIGGPNYDEANSVIQSSDGGYVLVGSTSSFGAGDFDIYIVKLDSNGNLSICPNGCQLSLGGTVQITNPGVGSGGTVNSGGIINATLPIVGSGGVLTRICP